MLDRWRSPPNLLLRAIGSLACASVLSACSSLILASGTSEEEIIASGTTEEELRERLGPPSTMKQLAPPVDAQDLSRRVSGIEWLMATAPRSDRGGNTTPLRAVAVADFTFVGTLKRRHDVGESVGMNLMTFGILEPLMSAEAIARRSGTQGHLVRVWFSELGTAIGYKWYPSAND